jgi:hypothetical protein
LEKNFTFLSLAPNKIWQAFLSGVLIVASMVPINFDEKKTFFWQQNLTLALINNSPERKHVYDNDYSLIIDIYFYETFSTLTQKHLVLALHSLDTLSDVRIKAFTLLF